MSHLGVSTPQAAFQRAKRLRVAVESARTGADRRHPNREIRGRRQLVIHADRVRDAAAGLLDTRGVGSGLNRG